MCVLQAPPAEVQAYQELLDQGTAGFLTVSFLLRELALGQLEPALQSIVYFPDFINRSIASCKLLTKAGLRRKFSAYQQSVSV